jgi:hypothetical protein
MDTNLYLFRIKSCFNKIKFKYYIYFFVFIFIFFISFFVYKRFILNKNKIAFKDLNELVIRYEGLQGETNNEPYEEFLNDINISIEKNKWCSFLNYFLLCKAVCLFNLEKNDEALQIIESIKKFIKNNFCNEWTFVFYISSALHLLRQGDKKYNDIGLNMINECMRFKENPLHEAAIFYYGLHLFHSKGLNEANVVWRPFEFDPKYKNSVYASLLQKARNFDI